MVKKGDFICVEKMEEKVGATVKVEKVLLLADGKSTRVGTPYLTGESVEVKVVKTALSDKVHTFKMKSKKRYKRSKGHRQPYTEIQILKV